MSRSIFANCDEPDERAETVERAVGGEGGGKGGADGIGICCLPLMSASDAARSAARFQPSSVSRSKRRTSLSISFAQVAQSHIPFEESQRCSADKSV